MRDTAEITTSSFDIHDDPLLLALQAVCKLVGRPQSPESLIAGLPLSSGRLTSALFGRAAERAGLSARLLRRPVEHISPLVLPAVLLLNDGNCCVLVAKQDRRLTLLLPETGGEKLLDIDEFAPLYSGLAFFIQVSHGFDARVGDGRREKPKHWFWDVIFKSWPIYVEVGLAALLINLFALASPLFFMNVYDRVVPNHAVETLWMLAIGVAIVFVFELLMKLLRGYFIDAAGQRSDVLLSSAIFENLLGMRMAAKPASIGAFTNNLQAFEAFREFFTSATLATLVDLPFQLLFVVIIYTIAGNLALIPLLMLPLASLLGVVLQAPLKSTVDALFKSSAQKNALLVEALASLETLKSCGAESQWQRRWEQSVGRMARLNLKSRFYASLAVNLTLLLQQLASIAVIIAGVYRIADGELTTGGLVACTMLTSRALAPAGQLAALLTRYHQARAALSSLNRMMALPVESEAGKTFVQRPPLTGAIEFKNVDFSYPGQPMKALSGVSFKIKAGEKVGLIGRIGSGKTTVEKLLMGFYQADDGAVLVDGADIRQLDPAQLRRQIGYVPQDIALVFGSVKDNIALGADFVDDSAVVRAADVAGVTAFVNRHPEGFAMPVGERGAALSGGQRQSIALARALLLAPPIYIMDEPTNAMDNSSEEAFKQRFAEQLAGETLILVTHRASLLSLVDRLIVLDGGQLVADGPKQQVLDALKLGKIRVAND